MPRVQVFPAKIDIDFTDEKLRSHGGWVFLGRLFKQLEPGRRLGEAICLKRRRRGAADAQMLLSLEASEVAGGGCQMWTYCGRIGWAGPCWGWTRCRRWKAVVQSVAREMASAVMAHREVVFDA